LSLPQFLYEYIKKKKKKSNVLKGDGDNEEFSMQIGC